MKRILIILPFFLITLCGHVMGQRFVSDGIVYEITSSQTVEVKPSHLLPDIAYSGSITIPQTVEYEGSTYTVTALGDRAFEDCGSISSITLPASIRHIGAYCFYNCSFTTLQLPDFLRSIGPDAFLYSYVSSLHLPACFEEYDDATFWARSLKSITVDDNNPYYRSIGGWLFSKDSLTLCIVPDGVIGTINVPSYVRHIGNMAFAFNPNFTSVSLPENLQTIGAFAFNCCALVNNITIPATVTHIGICPFSYCPRLSNLSIASGNTHYVMDGLMLYNIGYDTLISCHKSGATVTLNSNVKVVGGFENNTWVRNIDFPSGVDEISDNCFNGCNLTSIQLPSHMKRIGADAFGQNRNLTTVVMPTTLLSMGERAFALCDKLNSITIPDSLHIIPEEAFLSCYHLSSITFGNDVEEIGQAAFEEIAARNITLPTTLKRLGNRAFAECDYLRSVTLPVLLDTIGEAVFSSDNINQLHIGTSVPPTAKGLGPLYEIGRVDSIFVPCGSVGEYLADSYWGQFADKYYEDCNAIDDVSGEDAEQIIITTQDRRITIRGTQDAAVAVYDALGRQIHSIANATDEETIDLPSAGIYIVKVGDNHTSKIVSIRQ